MKLFRLRAIFTIARREFLDRIRSRSFIVSTLSLPLIMIAVIVISGLSVSRQVKEARSEKRRSLRVAIIGGDSRLPRMIQQSLNQFSIGEFAIEPGPPPSSDTQAQVEDEIRAGILDAALLLDKDVMTTGHAEYLARDQNVRGWHFLVGVSLAGALARLRLEDRGVAPGDAMKIVAPVSIQQKVLVPDRSAEALDAFGVAFVMAMVLMFSLLTYGTMVMRAVLDEKSTRIPEVLLCIVTSDELMAGKIAGIGCVGLVQIAIWAALFGALTEMAVAGSPVVRQLVSGVNLGAGMLLAFTIFYVLGYLFYSAMFAALGAAFNSLDEAQQWILVLLLPLLISTWMVVAVAQAPHSALAFTMSMIPLTSPVLMTTRIAAANIPLWEIALSIAILGVTVAVLISICAKIYRVGILMYGKPPNLREVRRWLRYT
ncbi:MAG TPA: ABC transporter permease [Candidatus Binataceae bacterium]|nr:ABC transporter permease [Candidatus Binataceae bacterium]